MPTIRDLREAKGWTREALSAQSGVSTRTIARIESEENAEVNPSTLKVLCQALEVHPSEITGVTVKNRVLRRGAQ